MVLNKLNRHYEVQRHYKAKRQDKVDSHYVFVLVLLSTLFLSACASKQGQNATIVAVHSPEARSLVEGSTTDDTKVDGHKSSYSADPFGSKRSPAIIGTLLQQAKQAQSNKNWSSARQILNKAQRIAPKDENIYLQFGLLYQEMGQTKQAIHMLKRAQGLTKQGSAKKREIETLLRQLQAPTQGS